ncbi:MULTISPECIES: chemotaxis response regulator protein-glutamate methylesterase [unclassified Herbaspirillum]|uniref:chemotaxis response regulator protein-glutamate methylesterase n=1 Tax=unclassified Herbaspirillum TaxID=2624150 RepID=UPI000E2EE45B|nr:MULTISPECIES: chemotaxis response regulator protein-glutamate methylesterase [unclassified Herbaspirillum]RFB73659.1 chemotaxis response regulator protein-glutamate methylesterase [Herbaspirillum sp. 3R-3a1]TFI10538.1 chemotaxis response regulator protein-glutamate methylesterase [Herbaspirillum sp. 3R11]TFI16443.1 chemotaxis response regulator protein-glutamate methylesterase [Herbaspirillum sp. 3R-11]TFI21390.1 chemotaxis response regulator protein-glutamate methylesterase [Herbaspirillum 
MKIAIVNDVSMVVEILRRVLAEWPEHQLLWVAQDGAQAVELCAWQLPDLILMDIVMPGMDGVEATRRIMQQTPCPILIVTADIGACADKVYQALGHGALDAVDTPALSGSDWRQGSAVLMEKIDRIGRMERKSAQSSVARPKIEPRRTPLAPTVSDKLVAIGASAGGPGALATILRTLPDTFPAAIVIVQHIDPGFAGGMAGWLQQQSGLAVKVAQEGDRPQRGTVLMAGTNQHLLFRSRDSLGYVPESPEDVYHPSIDVFFNSVVRQWRGQAVGVLLTGMGRDGAAGLKAIRDAGYHTIAQDRESSSVYGMPKAAAALDAATEILPIANIAKALVSQFT